MKILGKELTFNGNKVYHAGNKPTASEIGAAASSHTHNYAGSSSAGGNANAAVKLATARTINGTSFDGSANITTANWGTARNIQIGNTSKSVNGSGNVSWSLSEIGAAPAGYGLGTTCQDKSNQDCNNILVTGFYMGSNMTNKPSGCTQGWIYLLVMRHNDSWVRQVAYDFGTASQVYTRVKQNGSWTAWVATDTNTWRGVQDNLTSTATDQSLSANQGKVLKGLIDGKAASNHTHSYVPLANGGNITIHADSDSSSTGEYALIKAGHNELKIASSAGGTTVTKGQDKLTFNGNIVYHAGRKPTISEIGAAAASHTHNSITNQDTRNVNTTPTQMPLGLSVHLKSNSTDGLDDGGAYHSTLMIKGWNDASGGPFAQMTVTANNNLYFRSSNNDTWNAWKKVSLDGHTHNYAGSSSAGGNANAAVKLATARTINGTSFDGTANITTANWGTARNIQIGNTAKSVNGSANVTWTLGEIGAAASNHTHNYAGSSSAGGAANSATKLATARSINGTNFDGTGNITTANWGTARTITIGKTAKSVNGSANVTWTAAEIGVASINDSTTATDTVWSSNKTQVQINTSYNTMSQKVDALDKSINRDFVSKNGGTMTGDLTIKKSNGAAAKLNVHRTINSNDMQGTIDIYAHNGGAVALSTNNKTSGKQASSYVFGGDAFWSPRNADGTVPSIGLSNYRFEKAWLNKLDAKDAIFTSGNLTVQGQTILGPTILNNNTSLYGYNTSGTQINICGVDNSNNIYLGWNNQTYINVNNTMRVYRDLHILNGNALRVTGQTVLARTESYRQIAVVSTAGDGNGKGDGQTHLGYFDNGYHHYFRGSGAMHVDMLGGLRIDGKRLSIGSAAHSNPATGDVWIQI